MVAEQSHTQRPLSLGDIVHLNSGSDPGTVAAFTPDGRVVIDWSGNGLEATILPPVCVYRAESYEIRRGVDCMIPKFSAAVKVAYSTFWLGVLCGSISASTAFLYLGVLSLHH
jgi:hypothetical protein